MKENKLLVEVVDNNVGIEHGLEYRKSNIFIFEGFDIYKEENNVLLPPTTTVKADLNKVEDDSRNLWFNIRSWSLS